MFKMSVASDSPSKADSDETNEKIYSCSYQACNQVNMAFSSFNLLFMIFLLNRRFDFF